MGPYRTPAQSALKITTLIVEATSGSNTDNGTVREMVNEKLKELLEHGVTARAAIVKEEENPVPADRELADLLTLPPATVIEIMGDGDNDTSPWVELAEKFLNLVEAEDLDVRSLAVFIAPIIRELAKRL